jgi:predicted NAD-dependent protein-ADP-ribosyltransferase YbiA (DUF1768 family)
MTKGGDFLPGHDARHKGNLIRLVKERGPGALDAGDELVERKWKTREWVTAAGENAEQKELPKQESGKASKEIKDQVTGDAEDDEPEAVAVVVFGNDSPLSPHADTPFSIDGVEWPSVTHYLLAMRLSNEQGREDVRTASNVGWAKRKFAKHQEGEGNENASFDLFDELRNATFAKMAFSAKAKKRLMETADSPLGWDDKDPDLGMYGDNLVGRALEEARQAYQ